MYNRTEKIIVCVYCRHRYLYKSFDFREHNIIIPIMKIISVDSALLAVMIVTEDRSARFRRICLAVVKRTYPNVNYGRWPGGRSMLRHPFEDAPHQRQSSDRAGRGGFRLTLRSTYCRATHACRSWTAWTAWTARTPAAGARRW